MTIFRVRITLSTSPTTRLLAWHPDFVWVFNPKRAIKPDLSSRAGKTARQYHKRAGMIPV